MFANSPRDMTENDMIVLDNGSKLLCPNPHAVGSKVSMSLRPESIRIGTTDAVPVEDEGTSLRGVVSNMSYLGHALLYTVKVDGLYKGLLLPRLRR